MGQSLFDYLGDITPQESLWVPEAPEPLTGVTEIVLNVETSGLQWWRDARPTAISLYYNGKKKFYPFRQRNGNLDESQVKRFCQVELRGKHITNFNTKFDIHQLRAWGIDLEAQGNTVSDVAHYAALLDDHRYKTNLDTLIEEYIGPVAVPRRNESRNMGDYDAAYVAQRAMYNVEMVAQLRDIMIPKLVEQDLMKVKKLEDEFIYVVCEMEKNGAPIDVELLDKYIIDCNHAINKLLFEVARETGFKVNPNSPTDMKRVFQKLKLQWVDSAKDIILKHIPHPTIQKIRRVKKLMSVKSKYLDKYRRSVDSNGILRYSIHQLRMQKDDSESGHDVGTISGRCSSTSISRTEGANIQQEFKASKQRVAFGYDEKDSSHDDEICLIRKLRIPHSESVDGYTPEWLSADAMQVEYRLFAHYANNPKVNEAYRVNPRANFHRMTLKEFQVIAPTMPYDHMKNCNFANVYGAKEVKLALMFGKITEEDAIDLNSMAYKDRMKDPRLIETIEIKKIYNIILPEVEPLLKMTTHVAMPECNKFCRQGDELHQKYPHRGYVRDLIGRRARFPGGKRTHKALNGVVQGGAASIAKQKAIDLHREKEYTGFLMRYVVHDSNEGDSTRRHTKARVLEILDRQSFDLRVPILWEVKTGRNWAEC